MKVNTLVINIFFYYFFFFNHFIYTGGVQFSQWPVFVDNQLIQNTGGIHRIDKYNRVEI